MIEDVKNWEIISLNLKNNCGEVYFGDECVGSCVSILVSKGRMFIITCRHVVLYRFAIDMSKLCFKFHFTSYSGSAISYSGSSSSEIDLVFFEVNTGNKSGFILDSELTVYQGQDILVASYPTSIDNDLITGSSPKINCGKVSAALVFDSIALTDVSSTLPSSSGGAVASIIDQAKHLLGIHMGTFWHEDLENKPETQMIRDSNTILELYAIQHDKVLDGNVVTEESFNSSPSKDSSPPGLDLKALEIDSPPENIRLRGLYALDNVPHKGSMSYFVTARTIVMYLAQLIPDSSGITSSQIMNTQSKRARSSGTK
jgi:hypothetical protein